MIHLKPAANWSKIQDHLFPHTIWATKPLAKHIGATSNYVSQTLNETLGESFFDYINRWRIKDAVHQMKTSEETILVLAYDVGFNSRSSFYKAFKREIGMTPSQFRQLPKNDMGGPVTVHKFPVGKQAVNE